MKKLYPTTLATLVLSAIVATTGISAAQASVNLANQDVATSSKEQVLNIERVSAVQPSLEKVSALPLSNQVTLLDSIKNGFSQKPVLADPKAVVSFERTQVKSTPAPPDPAVVAAEKAAKEKAEKAKIAAESAASAETTTTAGTPAQTSAGTAQKATTATGTATPATTAAPAPSLPQNLTAYQQYAAEEMSRRGLNGASELKCLIPLWNHESGWNPNAANPTSTARGIPQMMMNIHYGADWQTNAAGVAYLTNPQVQINKGLDYIIGRYGTPCNAWGIWQTQSWY